jgi:hypothetical protein
LTGFIRRMTSWKGRELLQKNAALFGRAVSHFQHLMS